MIEWSYPDYFTVLNIKCGNISTYARRAMPKPFYEYFLCFDFLF